MIVSKYADHSPLYRQSEILCPSGSGTPALDHGRMGWCSRSADLLSPLVDAIQKHVLAGRKLHAD